MVNQLEISSRFEQTKLKFSLHVNELKKINNGVASFWYLYC